MKQAVVVEVASPGKRSLRDWLVDYQADYLVALGLAPRTRQEYGRDVRTCIAYLTQVSGVATPTAITLAALRRYLAARLAG